MADTPMTDEFRRLRAAGVTLPNHPVRAQQSAKELITGIQDGSSQRAAVMRYKRGSLKAGSRSPRIATVEDARNANRRTASGDIALALDKQRDPLRSFQEKGIPFQTDDEQELMKIREWARALCNSPSPVSSD